MRYAGESLTETRLRWQLESLSYSGGRNSGSTGLNPLTPRILQEEPITTLHGPPSRTPLLIQNALLRA